jgi:hypothetical protein
MDEEPPDQAQSLTIVRPTAVALLLLAASPAHVPSASLSTATARGGTLWVSPSGRGRTLSSLNSVVTVHVLDGNGAPIANFPFQDIWLASAKPGEINLCPGGSSADANTDAAGTTTISGTLRGGGFTEGGLVVALSGAPITGSPPLAIEVNSPDITGDRIVNLADVGPFAADLRGAFNFRSDLFADGLVNLADVGIFSAELGAVCH